MSQQSKGYRSLAFLEASEACSLVKSPRSPSTIPQHDRSSYVGAIQGIGMYESLQASRYDIVFVFSGILGGEGCNRLGLRSRGSKHRIVQ